MKKRNIITAIATTVIAAASLFGGYMAKTSNPISKTLQANPDIIWSGDAETGDLSQWCLVNQFALGRISVVNDPVAQGQYAYRFELDDNDTVFGTERVTLSQQCDGRYEEEGQDKYFSWSVYLLDDFFKIDLWSLVTQWKGIHTGSPPISLNLRNGNWMLNYRPTTSSGEIHKWTAPATKGRWENFVLHVKWSPNPTIGFIEFWHNGKLVVPLFHTSTMHLDGGTVVKNYVAMGLYRDANINTNAVLYHDGMTVGKTYASVTGGQPPVTSVPPTGTPVSATRTPTLTRTATNTPLPGTITFTPISVTPTRTPVAAPTCDPEYLPFICIYRMP